METLELASKIDHTLLRPDATGAEVDILCDEALLHGFACVCVHGAWVSRCAARVAGSRVVVCAVVGFPAGAMASDVKVFEATRAVSDGARELDMVMSIGPLKAGDHAFVERDIGGVVRVCRANDARLKVILETGLLSDAEKIRACEIAKAAGADFVKTSTGFAKGGATVADVALLRSVVGPAMGVKASGGIHDARTALEMLCAGANRIGSSKSLAIVGG